MIYKSISSKALIAKIYRDFKPNNSSWVNDAIEWMGEAIACINAFHGFIDTSKCINIVDYRGKLPCDLEQLQGITYCGKKLERTGGIKSKRHCKSSHFLHNTICCNVNSYSLNPNYIHTSFKEGEIIVYYLGLDVDNDGFPNIPDNFFVKEAISWYIISRMLLRGFKHPVVNYEMADTKWIIFYPRAQNACKFPDIDGQDLFKRTYLGLARDINMSDKMFEDTTIT
jgi:hypothetical protein